MTCSAEADAGRTQLGLQELKANWCGAEQHWSQCGTQQPIKLYPRSVGKMAFQHLDAVVWVCGVFPVLAANFLFYPGVVECKLLWALEIESHFVFSLVCFLQLSLHKAKLLTFCSRSCAGVGAGLLWGDVGSVPGSATAFLGGKGQVT